MNELLSRFLNQLRFWSFHCAVCAAPSFLMAGILLEYFKSAHNTAAMLLGISFFIIAYAALSTFWTPLIEPQHILSRALRVALKVRLIVSVLSLLPLIPLFIASEGYERAMGIIFLPDYWAGWLAYAILEVVSQLLGSGFVNPEEGSFLSTLLWTILEGGILSFALFMLTFFCLLIVTAQQKRKWQKEGLSNPTSSESMPTSPLDQELSKEP